MNNKKYYTGVGSRTTPYDVCNLMSKIGKDLQDRDYILRSGHADGADCAFEKFIIEDNKEIWVPWKGFNGSSSNNLPSPESFVMASKFHPIFSRLNKPSQSLHARNCHQVLGKDLQTPSMFLICWTEDGEQKGGTATAIKIAKYYRIPVLNLGKYSDILSMQEAVQDFIILNGVMNNE